LSNRTLISTPRWSKSDPFETFRDRSGGSEADVPLNQPF
jgi:hypothetical protein